MHFQDNILKMHVIDIAIWILVAYKSIFLVFKIQMIKIAFLYCL
jgi:hypothetical protein